MNYVFCVSVILIDIICIVESWLSSDKDNSELFITGFAILRKDRSKHGGEIVVFVRSSLPCSVLSFEPPTLLHTPLKFLPLCVEFCKRKFCISVFYRPLSSDVAYFDTFCNAVESLDIVKYSNFILLGDFNIDFYNTGHHLMSRLTNFCNSLMLTQVVTKATHVSSAGNHTLIDLALIPVPPSNT